MKLSIHYFCWCFSFFLRQNNFFLFSLLSLKKFLIIKVAHECCLPMVIIWISVLLIIKAVNSCVYECSARKLFHSSGHGSPNMTEFWMWLFKYHTAFIIMWIYTLYAEKWSMYLRKKQRHTCNRQSSARTWSDLLQVRRLWFLSMWEGEAEKRNSIKTESDAIQRNLKLFNFFFLTLWCFFSHICECKKTCIELSGNSSRFLCDFFSPSPSLFLSKERGVWEGVWIFLIICFEILLVVFLWNAY